MALAGSGLAEGRPQVQAKVGPVEFYVIPEIGAGLSLTEAQTIEISPENAFVLIRIPGLKLPDFNDTATGVQVELSKVAGLDGVVARYEVVSYTRTKVAGPMFTGANIRVAIGTNDIGTKFDGRVMPVVGFEMLSFGGHVPISLEIELLAQSRPVRVALIVGWR